MRIGPNKIKWNSEYGKLLEEALILTKEEQIFGMSNGILELNTHKNFYDGVLPMGVVLAMYTAARYINHRENLYIRPPYVSKRPFSFCKNVRKTNNNILMYWTDEIYNLLNDQSLWLRCVLVHQRFESCSS